MMPERASRTFICSVLFLDIVGYSRKPVAEQIRLKDRFNVLIATAIREIAPADRIILDTGDGVAISFLGDPEDALFVAMSLRDAFAPDPDEPPEVPARIGLNLGPVRLVRDLNGRPNIIGDGINVAQRVMARRRQQLGRYSRTRKARRIHRLARCLVRGPFHAEHARCRRSRVDCGFGGGG